MMNATHIYRHMYKECSHPRRHPPMIYRPKSGAPRRFSKLIRIFSQNLPLDLGRNQIYEGVETSLHRASFAIRTEFKFYRKGLTLENPQLNGHDGKYLYITYAIYTLKGLHLYCYLLSRHITYITACNIAWVQLNTYDLFSGISVPEPNPACARSCFGKSGLGLVCHGHGFGFLHQTGTVSSRRLLRRILLQSALLKAIQRPVSFSNGSAASIWLRASQSLETQAPSAHLASAIEMLVSTSSSGD